MINREQVKEAIVELVYYNCGVKASELWMHDDVMKPLMDAALYPQLDEIVAELIEEERVGAITYLVSAGGELYPRQFLLPIGSLVSNMSGVRESKNGKNL